jgi:hypothetical protein
MAGIRLQSLCLDLCHLLQRQVEVMWSEIGELCPLVGEPEMFALAHYQDPALGARHDRLVPLDSPVEDGV